MARIPGTSCLVVFLCCAVFTAVVAQSGIPQTTAALSEARAYLAATSLGDLVFFGGGGNGKGPSARVDIYNVTSDIWTTATLSVPRPYLAAASSGNLVFFAGGWNGTTYFNQVDMYNVSDGSWSIATLSQSRADLAATSVGNLVLFGGGCCDTYGNLFNVVDIYNVTSNTWTTATLSQARGFLAATSVANRYALFAGGCCPLSNVVDIFDSFNGTWNTTTLIQGASVPAAASLSNLSFIGGGDSGNPRQPFNKVNIFNATSQTWSTATLSRNRTWLAAALIGDIVAFGGGTPDGGANYAAVVDMYNATSGIWFTAILSQPRGWLAAASSTNKIFFGGGNSSSGVSNTVDIFCLNGSDCGPNGALIGGLIGGIVGALLVDGGIVILVILLRRKRKQKKTTQTTNKDDKTKPVESDKNGATLESVRQTVTLESGKTVTMTYAQTVTETLKSLTPGQIRLNELEIGREIGNGNYGRVCVGKWKGYQVALKFCQHRGKMDEFMREVNLMISLPPHPNIVRMYGVSIDGTQPIIVMEYCAGGSLDKLLFDTEEHISDEQKIRWVHEIALGMCHLHRHNIVHRDLAARNILLSHPNLANAHPKIADFGMSRVLEQTASVVNTLNRMGPIRWMAPESLARQIYSKKSDVWMFGILIYEVVARYEPHTDMTPNEAAARIRDEGLTPTIPTDCPPKLREVMQLCWKMQPQHRPNFEAICALLEQ